MKEVWKDIVGYEKYYQVSSLGRIRSLTRTVNHCFGEQKKRGQILKKQIDRKGHEYIILQKKNKKNKSFLVRRLVMISFGENKNLPIANKNSNKLDNRFSNLFYLTLRENYTKRFTEGRTNADKKAIGAYFDKKNKSWKGRICIDGKNYHIGSFNTEEEASCAYKDVAKKGIIRIKRYRKYKKPML